MAEFPKYEEWVKEAGKKAFNKALNEYIYNGKTLREWIDVLAQTQWIPISERLPEIFTSVLVTIQVGDREPVVRSGCYYIDGLFHIDNGDCWRAEDKELIAWMPLPEPYKEESEEQEMIKEELIIHSLRRNKEEEKMNKKFAELTVRKSADYYDKVIKTLENAGFVLVLEEETFTDKRYIVAESEENRNE